ncbi:MAG: riboflavin synthase [Alphaproteobacteria bacterium]|nr:riboflavin synthase [Alphaproteobacteria bacterium]
MFTGIITDIGTVRRVTPGADTRIEIVCSYDVATIPLGASIACSGPCLTVIETGRDGARGWFAVEASPETLKRTTIGAWAAGTRVNLERALRVGDELGGHMVSGHVDGIAEVVRRETVGEGDGGSARFTIRAPANLARFIAEKGSVALGGVSLTVNEVDGSDFAVNVIPHTLAQTTLGAAQVGTRLNLEVDPIARYVARLRGA